MGEKFVFLMVVACVTVLSFAQQNRTDLLPQPYECGLLREEQFNNLENTVDDNEFPWLAKLFFDRFWMICLGILVHKNYVLTTATCLRYTPPIDGIQLGSCGMRICLKVRDLEPPIIHPSYDPDNDEFENVNIGMLRFKTPIIFTPYIRPICLPSTDVSEMEFEAQSLPLTGVLFDSGGERIKKSALILSLEQCRNYYSNITANYICSNTCEDGSRFIIGSSLMGVQVKNGKPDHYYLIALQERGGDTDCEQEEPDIFLRVDRHVNWMVNIIFERETTESKTV